MFNTKDFVYIRYIYIHTYIYIIYILYIYLIYTYIRYIHNIYIYLLYIYIYICSICIGGNYFRQLHRAWKNGGRSELSKSIKSIYSVLDYLWSDGNDFNFLVSYIKPDYKIYRRTLKNLKDNFLSDDIISCYLDELVVSSQKVNKILIFKSTISATNIFFVTYQITGNFLQYLRKPILYFSHCWNAIISSALLSL